MGTIALMNNTPPDLERRLQSFINRGIVTEVDYAAARCRVQIDSLVTDWLKFTAARIGNVKIWNPPSVGEQVLVISETGELETALVTTSFDYNDQPLPSANANTIEMHCKDGAAFIYNHNTHTLSVSLPDDSTTQINSNRIEISANDVSISSTNYSVACTAYAVDCQSYSLNSQSNSQNGVLKINGQPYLGHKHSGVESGSSSTGGVNA